MWPQYAGYYDGFGATRSIPASNPLNPPTVENGYYLTADLRRMPRTSTTA